MPDPAGMLLRPEAMGAREAMAERGLRFSAFLKWIPIGAAEPKVGNSFNALRQRGRSWRWPSIRALRLAAH